MTLEIDSETMEMITNLARINHSLANHAQKHCGCQITDKIDHLLDEMQTARSATLFWLQERGHMIECGDNVYRVPKPVPKPVPWSVPSLFDGQRKPR